MTFALLLLLACGAEPKASPPDLQQMCQALLRDFDDADAVTADAELLAAWLDEAVLSEEEGYTLEPLTDADVAGLDHSADLALDLMDGAVVPYLARGGLDAYAAVVPEADQSFADDTYAQWDREIVRGTAEDYLAGGELGTDDDIVKDQLGVALPYRMVKDYRWVELERGPAQVMRTVVPDEGWDEDGKNGILGGFTIELWVPDEDGNLLWANASWTLLETVVDDFVTNEDFWIDQLIGGTRDYMIGTEAHVNGEDE